MAEPTAERSQEKVDDGRTFQRRVRQSITRVGGRDFVLVTYHNIGMIDWATLFWGWLERSGIRRFMLLELDGLTCDASTALNASISFQCVTGNDLMLPKEYTEIKNAGAVQEWGVPSGVTLQCCFPFPTALIPPQQCGCWELDRSSITYELGTSAESAYFKFLRWKLRIVELILMQQADALMADVDVLILSPNFFTWLVQNKYDLTISSDARTGVYNDNQMCPCSHPMYQRYSVDWVCAGLFYLRSTAAGLWFIREVQKSMDDFTITDQDAIQAVLTGHTQVAVPQMKRVFVNASAKGRNSVDLRPNFRPSSAWLKPLWLEGLAKGSNLVNTNGIQPLNTPMKEAMWHRYQMKQRKQGFTWTMAPVAHFGNGPKLVDRWDSLFSRNVGSSSHEFVSIHANCNTKAWLAADTEGASFLLHPGEAEGKSVT